MPCFALQPLTPRSDADTEFSVRTHVLGVCCTAAVANASTVQIHRDEG
jgi:hypothetical protein